VFQKVRRPSRLLPVSRRLADCALSAQWPWMLLAAHVRLVVVAMSWVVSHTPGPGVDVYLASSVVGSLVVQVPPEQLSLAWALPRGKGTKPGTAWGVWFRSRASRRLQGGLPRASRNLGSCATSVAVSEQFLVSILRSPLQGAGFSSEQLIFEIAVQPESRSQI
jgi:hypothetical protein